MDGWMDGWMDGLMDSFLSSRQVRTVIGGKDVPAPPGFRKCAVDLCLSHLGFRASGKEKEAHVFLCYRRGLGAPITQLAVASSQLEAARLASHGYQLMQVRVGAMSDLVLA